MSTYLRVVGGFFAAVFVWVSLRSLLALDIAGGLVGLLLGAGLWYLVLAKPLRERRARVSAGNAALAARADAGHAAFLSGDPDPYLYARLPGPSGPSMRTGVKVTIGIAAALFAVGVLGDLTGSADPAAAGKSDRVAKVADRPAELPPTADVADPMRFVETPEAGADTAAVSADEARLPELAGQNAAIAEHSLEKLGLTDITLESGNSKYSMVLVPQNWTVVGVDPGPGTVVSKDDPVIVTVTKQ